MLEALDKGVGKSGSIGARKSGSCEDEDFEKIMAST